MDATTTTRTTTAGGSFLLGPTAPDAVFTPEDLTEEQRLVHKTVLQFVEQEIVPHLKQLEQHDWDLTRRLIRRTAELGFLGLDIPEAYGGAGLDKVTSLIVKDAIGTGSSF